MAKKTTETTKKTAPKAAPKAAVKKKAPAAAKKPATAKPALKSHTFTLTAPGALAASVAGAFNNWDSSAGAMKKGKDGVWSITLKLKPGRYEYKFVVDGAWWADPANPLYVFNQHGTTNSVIEI